MSTIRYAVLVGLALFTPLTAEAGLFRKTRLAPLNTRLAGQVVDHTANHGGDYRIWSNALCEKRDMYVYLPPCFDPAKKYPLILWFHGITQDERGLLEEAIEDIDQAMQCGKLPPAIIAIPDGSLKGRKGLYSAHSGFLNTRAGNFEDYLIQDVYPFVLSNYPIRPEREAHVLAGVSIGGGSAFYQGMKQRNEFGVVVGVFPPLNLRWLDCHGHYFGNFSPDCWGWRENYHLGLMPVGRFYGVVTVPWYRLVHPLYGHGPGVIPQLSRDNPIEFMEREGLKDGELQMLVAYGKRDEFNIDAQAESFLYRARELGIHVDCLVDPRGHHDLRTARRMLPEIFEWLSPRLAPYSPK